ncbi:MAG: plastocyanin/azurin family copper-binding protein [Bacteroidota bacterium]|nr:plastocyanin/azurin family copper-binding protein [Bacteroidota bacterium]
MKRNRKFINNLAIINSLFVISLIFTLSLGCKKDSSPTNSGYSSSPNEILMQSSSFSPSSKTITSGTTITWTNKDGYAHTVTSGVPGTPDGVFDSGNMNAGGTYSFKFSKTGTYKYYCRIHGSMMTGVITVQ